MQKYVLEESIHEYGIWEYFMNEKELFYGWIVELWYSRKHFHRSTPVPAPIIGNLVNTENLIKGHQLMLIVFCIVFK